MSNPWIRLGCFLTGYNYRIVSASSEISAKAVKRYTSAILIVCLLWTFIGYTFTQRYLFGTPFEATIGAGLMILIVIQIERQIILSVRPSKPLLFARFVIAILMATIGSIIIDQIIFKQDIELEKITYIQTRVNAALPGKTEELRSQIASMDSAIQKKEAERTAIIDEVTKTPLIKSTSTQVIPSKVQTTITDSTGKKTTSEKIVPATSIVTTNIPNPKQSLIAPLDQTITELRKLKNEREAALLNARPQLENEIKSKVGFLDELKVMAFLISESRVALAVWIIWFLFLFSLEILVLVGKLTDKENDYEKTIFHQMNLQIKKLELLANLSTKPE
jgi:hypothetical protein